MTSSYPQEYGRLDFEIFDGHHLCRRYIPFSSLTTVDRLHLEELLQADDITPEFTPDGAFYVKISDSHEWPLVHSRVLKAVRLVYNVWNKHFKVVEHQLPACPCEDHILQPA